MRTRWLAGAAAMVAALGLGTVGWLGFSSGPQPAKVPLVQLPTPSAPPVQVDVHRRVPVPVPSAEGPSDVRDAQERFTASATEVARHCGLVPQVACEGPRCVALLDAPDLDAASGWARMIVSHPRFVASTALRDLGVPAAALPCGDAIAAFDPERQGAAMVERSDGSEVWCVGRAEVCDAASESLGMDAQGFDQPGTRRLHFDR